MFLDNISPWNEYNVRPTVPPFCSNNQNNSTSSPGFLGQRFNMTVWFYPIRNGEIFWMNNMTTYWITKNDKAAHMLHVHSLEKHTFLASSKWRFKQTRLSACLVLIVEIIGWKPSSYAPYKNPALETSLSILEHLCFWECKARIS